MNILIVEDHPVFRDILQKILSDWFNPTLVVCAEDGVSAIGLLKSQTFTHLLLDLNLPDIDGFQVADFAMKVAPNIRIIALTSHCDHYTVYRTERRRISGFVDKRAATAWNCHQAIANVAAGLTYFSPSFLQSKSDRLKNPLSFDKVLSDREIAVLKLIAVPFSDNDISVELGISPKTVEKHRFNMLRKLNQRTTTELVRYARMRGIVQYPKHFPPFRVLAGQEH